MSEEIKSLKKIIKYRLSYSGTKETDILYKKIILKKIDKLSQNDLFLLSNLFKEISDLEIFDILTKKSKSPIKYRNIIEKIINE